MSRGCGRKCVYMDCGKSSRHHPDLSFHKFPKNEDIRKKWILNSGKTIILFRFYIYMSDV